VSKPFSLSKRKRRNALTIFLEILNILNEPNSVGRFKLVCKLQTNYHAIEPYIIIAKASQLITEHDRKLAITDKGKRVIELFNNE